MESVPEATTLLLDVYVAAAKAVELRLGTSPEAVQSGIADLVRALDAEIKERKAP